MNTPDIEQEDFPSEISMKVTDIVLNKESGWSRTLHNELNAYKNAIVASRDTYWKERVEEIYSHFSWCQECAEGPMCKDALAIKDNLK